MQQSTSETFSDRVMKTLGGSTGIVAGMIIWVVMLAITCVSVAKNPLDRTVTTNYRVAAEAFWAQKPMYSEGQHGWLYPPQGAVMYSPFAAVPSVAAGEVAWRVVITGVFAWSLLRLSRLAAGRSGNTKVLEGAMFLLTTAGSLALAAGCMRNGQMNLPLAGLLILSCCDLAERNWWRATLWLTLALMAKPIALPMVMLAGLLFPALWWRLPIGMLVFVALPFINPHWGYVVEQYSAALAKMKAAGEPGAGVFSDLIGMMQVFPVLGPGKTTPLVLNPLLATGLRMLAALFTLAMSYIALRRFAFAQGCFYLLVFCVGYLMLFNPRTEGNSYVMMVPLIAVFFGWLWYVERRMLAAAVMVAALILYAAAHEFYKDKLDSVWIRPLCTLFVCGWAMRHVLKNRPPAREIFAGK